MPKKIVFIGAGSFTFTRNLCRDLLTFPSFRDAELRLVDVNPENLDVARTMVARIIADGDYPAEIKCFTDRAAALDGADGVVSTIMVGSSRNDFMIPISHGVSINVGDTRGPAGIFRYLRTAPIMLGICADIKKYCPKAVFLNYTNPMAMLCRTMQGAYPDLCVTGLCHSVQGTAQLLADWIGADIKDVSYTCAGINHQAFYLKYEVNGEDAYPAIRAALENPEILNKEQVRNEMFLQLGYYPTESSGHNSEYNAWFRKRPDLLEKYCTHGTGWNPGIPRDVRYASGEFDAKLDRRATCEKWLKEPFPLERGQEFASYIFNAVFGDHEVFRFNGNVRNFGLIDNLPTGACVEVPTFASRDGIEPVRVGELPAQLALLNNISSRCEELAVEGFMEKDREKIYYACLFDPLTSAVLSMSEIREMVAEMFENCGVESF